MAHGSPALRILKILTADHRVLTTAQISRLLDVPDTSVNRHIAAGVESGLLVPVRAGVFLNNAPGTSVRPAEAVRYIRTGAIVSLQSVLGDTGVLNNYSPDVTAIIPLGGANTGGGGAVQTRCGLFRFYHMNQAQLYAGTTKDRLQCVPYLAATPEKALLDWIALSGGGHSGLTPPPPHDLDLDALDERRLNRLARAMGITEELDVLRESAEKSEEAMRFGRMR